MTQDEQLLAVRAELLALAQLITETVEEAYPGLNDQYKRLMRQEADLLTSVDAAGLQ